MTVDSPSPSVDVRSAASQVAGLVKDALGKGAEAVVGGGVDHEMGPFFFPPSVLVGCTPDMRVSREEIFGPVVSVVKFAHDNEALALSNE